MQQKLFKACMFAAIVEVVHIKELVFYSAHIRGVFESTNMLFKKFIASECLNSHRASSVSLLGN